MVYCVSDSSAYVENTVTDFNFVREYSLILCIYLKFFIKSWIRYLFLFVYIIGCILKNVKENSSSHGVYFPDCFL